MQPSTPRTTAAAAPPVSQVTAALDKRSLKIWTLISLATTGAAPLTVAAGGAAIAFAVARTLGIPVAYAAVAVLLAVFSVAYTKMAQLIGARGTFYNYISRGLGRTFGLGSALVAALAYNAMEIGLLGGFGAGASSLLQALFGVHVAWGWLALAGWAVVAVLGVTRIDLVGRILTVCLYAEVAVALALAVAQLAHPAGGRLDLATLNPASLVGAGAGAALVVAITGFVGFEVTAVFSTETRNPGRTVPAATFVTLAGTAVIYVLCSAAPGITLGSGRLIDRAGAEGTNLMFALAGPYLPGWFIDLGRVLLCTSLFAATLAFHTTASRYHASLGREGVLPAWLGALSRRHNTPIAGSLTQSALAVAVVVVYLVKGWDPNVYLFFWLTCLGGLGVLALMLAGSVAAIAFFARDRAAAAQANLWQRVVMPLLAAAGLGWVLWQTLAQFDVLLGVGGHDPARWLLPGLYLVALAGGVAWALVLKAGWPHLHARIGTSGRSAGALPGLAEASPVAAGPGGAA